MSSTLVIRDVDDSVVERLRALASAKNRTVEQEVRAMLEELPPVSEPFDRVAFATAISAMTPKGVEQTDGLILLRDDRSRDNAGE